MLDFEDLVPTTLGTHMPDTHGGVAWSFSDWHFISIASAPDEIFLALAGNGTTFFGPGGQDFYFDGADYWSRRGADANGRFYFVLSHDGAIVYDGREEKDGRQLFTAAHEVRAPGYTGLVDSVVLTFDAGGDDWDHLAMDNVQLRIVGVVPEPSAWASMNMAGGSSSILWHLPPAREGTQRESRRKSPLHPAQCAEGVNTADLVLKKMKPRSLGGSGEWCEGPRILGA